MDRLSLYAKGSMKKVTIKDFKKTMSKFTTGITVVCVKNGTKVYGKTVNSFNSLSLKPPLVLFSLGNNSSSIKIFKKSKYLSINILSNKQKSLSDHFSKKFQKNTEVNFFEGINNILNIKGCVANLECKLEDKIKKGDHTIFICKVIKTKYNDKLKPLSYYNSKYY